MNFPILKTPQEISKMRVVGQMVARVLSSLSKFIKPGMTTQEVDIEAARLIKEMGAKSSFRGYVVQGNTYPSTICISVEEEVVHGIPGKRIIQDGQLVSLDCGITYDGWHGDSALTIGVGEICNDKKSLLRVGYQALIAGINAAKVGNRISDISKNIQEYIESQGKFGIVEKFGGHGIGTQLHMSPYIPNTLKEVINNYYLSPGYTICLEPMVNLGTKKIKIKEDRWTIVTADNKPSVHFEHTIAITETGTEILTIRSDEYLK